MLRCAKANKRIAPIWYATFVKSNENTIVKDGFTLYTGDRGGEYTTPKPVRVNVALAGGDTTTQVFGTDLKYDKILVFDDTEDCTEIDEYSKLWVDIEPYKDGVLQPHDYEVRQIATAHDNHSYAVAIARVSRNENR